jgi:hypothetical protein
MENNYGLKDLIKKRIEAAPYNRTSMAEAFAKAIKVSTPSTTGKDYYSKVIPGLKGTMIVLDAKLYKELVIAGIRDKGCTRVSGNYYCNKTEEFMEYFIDACKKLNILLGEWEIHENFYYPRYEKGAPKD